MSEQNNGGPAFPVDYFDEKNDVMVTMQGMTLRDYFAARSMQVTLNAIGSAKWDNAEECVKEIARMSYEMADAMIKARG